MGMSIVSVPGIFQSYGFKIAQKQEDDLAALFDTPDLPEENENPAVNEALDHHNENAPRAGSASSQPKVVLNRKAKVSQGTAEIVPQPASEVKRRIQTYRNGDITARVNDIPTLLRDLVSGPGIFQSYGFYLAAHMKKTIRMYAAAMPPE